jgi:hypothetical protein
VTRYIVLDNGGSIGKAHGDQEELRRVDIHLDAETEEERRVLGSLSFRGKWRKGTKNTG